MRRTIIKVVQLQKVAFLVELVGVAVEVCKDVLEFGWCVLVDRHGGRLVAQRKGVAPGGRARTDL